MRFCHTHFAVQTLSPCDFHAFVPLKDALSGRRCGSDEVIEVVHKWIRKQPKTCFSDGIRKLADGYKPYVELEGLYVERQELLHTVHFVCG